MHDFCNQKKYYTINHVPPYRKTICGKKMTKDKIKILLAATHPSIIFFLWLYLESSLGSSINHVVTFLGILTPSPLLGYFY